MNKAERRRRLAGVLFLTIALGMLLAGQTILRAELKGVPFILFWLICLVFTFLTMVVALLDLYAMRRRNSAELHALLEKAVQDIAAEREARRQRTPGGHNSHG
jgi:type VI protein secretion system component VasK